MQITYNRTGMLAEVAHSTDKNGRSFAVAVVKGTFDILSDGCPLAAAQQPFIYADVHHGDPASTSLKYECDFAPFKPKMDVLVNGNAVSPNQRPVRDLMVGVAVGALRKTLKVTGDRVWERGVTGLRQSTPTPFVTMPVRFERSF